MSNRNRIQARQADRSAVDHRAERDRSYGFKSTTAPVKVVARRDLHAVRYVGGWDGPVEFGTIAKGATFATQSIDNAGFRGIEFFATFPGGWHVHESAGAVRPA